MLIINLDALFNIHIAHNKFSFTLEKLIIELHYMMTDPEIDIKRFKYLLYRNNFFENFVPYILQKYLLKSYR